MYWGQARTSCASVRHDQYWSHADNKLDLTKKIKNNRLWGVDDLLESLRHAGTLLSALYLDVAQLLLGEGLGVRVEPEHDLLVLERVLLEDTGLSSLLLGGPAPDWSEDTLDFARVDQAGEVGLGDDVGRQEVVLLPLAGLGGGSVYGVEGTEGRLGPDDEASEVTAGGELEEVQGRYGAGLNTGDVAESLHDVGGTLVGRVEDDERTTALAVTAATELPLSGTGLARGGDLGDVLVGTDTLQESDGSASLGQVVESSGSDDEGKLGDLRDAVTTGLDEGNGSRGGQGRCSSKTTLPLGDFDVPLAPSLGGRKHTTGTALITEGSLTGAMGSPSRDTGNTGDSATYFFRRQSHNSLPVLALTWKSSPVPHDSADVW